MRKIHQFSLTVQNFSVSIALRRIWNAATEAMACGIPVIASNAASLLEVVGDAAILVDPFQLTVLRRHETSFEDENKRNELSFKGMERATIYMG